MRSANWINEWESTILSYSYMYLYIYLQGWQPLVFYHMSQISLAIYDYVIYFIVYDKRANKFMELNHAKKDVNIQRF